MTVLVPASLARIDNRSLRCAARGRVVVADRGAAERVVSGVRRVVPLETERATIESLSRGV